MKKILLFCLFLGLVQNYFSQIILGKIQTESGTAISEVNVYLDGTKISTTSIADGTFNLDIQGQKSGNLIFQKDHYEISIFPRNQALGKFVKVIINPQQEIEEVVIIPYTEKAYKDYINFFLSKFLGYDREEVTIKNQRTLKFSYDKKNQFLKVKAPQTLIIENKKLGYTIQYNLLNFESAFKMKSTSYLGTSFFKENSDKKNVILNRMNAYNGSLMHFFRSLFKNELEKEGFTVNQARRIKNPKYPSEAELQKLEDYYSFVRSQKTMVVKLSPDLQEIQDRKNENSEFLMAILKTKMKESEFTKRKNGRLFLDFNDLLQVNFKKYFYEMKKGEIIKSPSFSTQTSIIHPEALEFEIFPEGISSDPDQLILEDDFSNQNVSKMLPLDYIFGN